MRLEDKSLNFVVNFLLGVAWAAVLIGAVSTFLSLYSESFFFAIVSALLAMIPGMVAVLFLEHFITGKEKYLELKKQTKIWEILLDKEKNNN
jgi:uncharacterized membrane protein YjjB (DUF3815 family)